MPRIPDSELERLKQEVSLLRLIESGGHQLTKRGKDYVMLCVFHAEKTPSLTVSAAKNLYHCFGCGAAGSVIDWVIKTQSVSLPHAVQILRNGAHLESERVGVGRSQLRHLPVLVAQDQQLLLSQVVASYHANLQQSPEALAYLSSRALVSSELIDTFRLGYANKSLTYRLPPGHTQAGRDMRAQLQAVGVYRASGHEHLNGCLVVPVIGMSEGANAAQSGQIMQLYGRRIAPNNKLSSGQPRHLYLARPLRGIWNEVALVAQKDIILCESLIDAMTFWCAGYRNVIASYGVNGFTADHWHALKQHGTQRILIAYDRDDAGNAAAEQLAVLLQEAGMDCFRVVFPKGMDVNDYAQKVQPAEKSLGVLLQQAHWLGKGQSPSVVVNLAVSSVPPVADIAAKEPSHKREKPAAVAPSRATSATAAPITSSLAAVSSPAAPEAPPASEPAQVSQTVKGELLLSLGERHWRIRGWQKNLSPEQMRVNVQVRRDNKTGTEGAYYVDLLDIYSAKQRLVYIKQAAIELGVPDETIKRDLGHVLLKLETLQDAALSAALTPKDSVPPLSESDTAAALALLKAPDLTDRLVADMERCGIVGEATNLLAGYLAAVSRKLDAPLAVLIQSSSAAGKSALMEAVLNLMPEEERIQYSAMTGQSLFYLGENDLQHKILAIAEEEGVRQAAYALKLLQSDGELTMASTGKDETTGNLVTKQYCVKGPVMLMLTTTAIDVDEELLNRCLVLTVNESREQTQAIHARQRAKQTLEGLVMDREKKSITTLHQNAQRLLKAVHVVNPYANQLTFLDDKTRMRRDHMKYLTLIRAIALLHQHQREVKSVDHRGAQLDYIEVTKDDIALANRIAHEVLGRTLDELPPQPRRLLTLLQSWVAQRCTDLQMQRDTFRFTRKQVREMTRWGDTQLKLYFARLVELEYLIAHYNGRRQATDYELSYDGKGDDHPHLMGLLDPSRLDNDSQWSDKNSEWSASGRAAVGMQSGSGRMVLTEVQQGAAAETPESVQKLRIQQKKNNGSSLAAVVDEAQA
ncbi:CHC2 zinc finger domain-containing protein [Glaciimonas sp. PAMC28666]|uniref:CHC2 zinc finger domain-containing protein n=1 Tax=Glaciimonas sp. PAMC28666 TaxID=2807626 RepID=UPI001966BBC6|nr:CHC2 zinc finger domain-containing protein [Glaciimonas sp. PAMC28666]QRX81616.1 toprim domain-containing protein [Glaciimonas sp. PAMC28666]QRX81625.1 toprim domain-containing protein [Glaciimonas sp. PAMC28666]